MTSLKGSGMSSSGMDRTLDVRALEAWVNNDLLYLRLEDGRELGVPLAWFPRLAHASADQLRDYRLIGGGLILHWPSIDEDLCVAGLLHADAPQSANVAVPA